MEVGQDVKNSANIVGTMLSPRKGADVNVKDVEGTTALHHAPNGGNTAVLDQGPNFRSSDRTTIKGTLLQVTPARKRGYK